MNDEIEKIRKQVREALDKKRYNHTLGVAYTAASLAMRWGEDVERAYIAGLLHDCAKNIQGKDREKKLKKYRVNLSESEKKISALIHAPLGAAVAEKEYGISDPEILDAIRCHTTGRPGMTLLEKIIFIADFIEPNRQQLPDMPEIRKLAFTDIDLCVAKIAKGSIDYIEGKSDPSLDPQTVAVYKYYSRLIEERKQQDE